jgi:hypothetical protein
LAAIPEKKSLDNSWASKRVIWYRWGAGEFSWLALVTMNDVTSGVPAQYGSTWNLLYGDFYSS